MPVTVPTFAGGASCATQAKVAPVPRPRNTAISTKAIPAGTSGGSFRAITIAITAAPASETIITARGPTLSDRMPPTGLAITAAMAKPAVRVPAPVRSKSYTSFR